MASSSKEDEQIQQWKLKQLIARLDATKGAGTSMISLIIRPGEQVSKMTRMLTEEYGAASNIKSRVNRLSVQSAIQSALQRLKHYNQAPPNGLVVFCGTGSLDGAKERKIAIDFEPFRPVNTALYTCGDAFDTSYLKTLLVSNETYGFVVIDGNGTLFGTLTGDSKRVLGSVTANLPKKQRKGGQSAQRYGRIRLERRQAYIKRVAELCTQMFISDNAPNVSGLVLAGLAELKTELRDSDVFDKRLRPLVVKMVDVSYGGQQGFKQAIELASDTLGNIKLVKEQKVLGQYFSEIKKDTGKYVYGTKDTMEALETGAVEVLILWDELDAGKAGDYLEVPADSKSTAVSEWLVDHHGDYGATLQLISDQTQEGSQYCKGFGGIGGLLRYRPEFLDLDLEQVSSDSDDDYFI